MKIQIILEPDITSDQQLESSGLDEIALRLHDNLVDSIRLIG